MPAIHFKATAYELDSWTVVPLPIEESKKLPSRSQIMVKGTINGAPFAMPIEPDGNGSHWIELTKQLQKAAGAKAGDEVTVTLEASKDWPEPAVPADFQKAINDDPKVQAIWKDITPMARWEWLRWINSTKVEATRARRIEVSCSKMLNGLRRPCCFNRSMCCVPDVSKNGVLLEPAERIS